MLYLKLNIQRFADDGVVTIGLKMDSKSFEAQIEDVQRQLIELDKEYAMISKEKPYKGQEKALQEIRLEAEKLNNKLQALRKNQAKLNEAHLFEGVGNSMSKIIKKVTKWGLAVFGIRSAYMAVRQAMNTITSQDAQLKADIDYMKNAIAYALEPLVRGIVELMKKLMYYVSYIIYKWTGKNIFENANKSLKNANKEANKLQKTLASFDEINVLNSNNDTSTNNALPSFDLTNYTNIPMPGWVDWIANNKDAIENVAIALGILFGAQTVSKILNATKTIMGVAGVGKAAGTGLLGVYSILLLISGITIYNLVKEFKKLKSASDDVKKSLEKLSKQETTIRIKMEGNYKTFWEKFFSPEGLDEDTINGTMGIAKDQIMRDTEDIIGEIDENLKYHFGDGILGILGLSDHDEWLSLLNEKAKTIYSNFQEIKKGYETSIITDSDYEEAIKNVDSVFKYVENFEHGDDKRIANLFGLSKEGLKEFKNDINTALSKIKLNKIKAEITADPSDLISKLEALKNNKLAKFIAPTKLINDAIETLKKMKKNALGGIINMPGKGVSLGYSGGYNQIAGEAGREGLIPMDNASQMALIGQELAKYVNINLTNITKLDSKVIAREQRKINAESDFAFNR